MAKTYQCNNCMAPWFNRDDNPVVWDTLNGLPIGFCECDACDLHVTDYLEEDYEEVYYLGTAPCEREGDLVKLLLDEVDLEILGWVFIEKDEFYLTKKGRKLLPLLLLVAADLSCVTSGP